MDLGCRMQRQHRDLSGSKANRSCYLTGVMISRKTQFKFFFILSISHPERQFQQNPRRISSEASIRLVVVQSTAEIPIKPMCQNGAVPSKEITSHPWAPGPPSSSFTYAPMYNMSTLLAPIPSPLTSRCSSSRPRKHRSTQRNTHQRCQLLRRLQPRQQPRRQISPPPPRL